MTKITHPDKETDLLLFCYVLQAGFGVQGFHYRPSTFTANVKRPTEKKWKKILKNEKKMHAK
jgi:hypothetical protein